MELAIELRMNIDPDDSPWLLHLSVREKEERRRAFWYSYRAYSIVQNLTASPRKLPIWVQTVKYPSQVYDPHPIYLNADHPLRSQLWNLIGSIKQHWAVPPPNLIDLFSSALESDLLTQLTQLQASANLDHLLLFENPLSTTDSDISRFISQTLASQSELCGMNLTYQSAITVFYRPLLFATALPSCKPDRLSDPHRTLIINVINQCLEATWRVYTLFRFIDFMSLGEGRNLVSEDEVSLFYIYEISRCDAFEGIIVFWFIACRMDPAWLGYLQSWDWVSNFSSQEFRKTMGRMLGWYFEESRRNGFDLAIAEAMSGMLEEMEEVSRTGIRRGIHDRAKCESVLAEITNAVSSIPSSSKEPRCFMGLLGMDIGKRGGWKSRTEESWRLFWKLNS
ncbi:hypothetical protein BCR33DRAFT_718666 [Rhizoclosmatium globosum]|uniref:Transcription factor domain-containing protein n=1 Tax=Rhizoclosmatium globosum TaxID=329046 RepID=A0A1Y2C4W4_9FUNG|nr:hypothetical protein BCR33DRAFT_718666 [Rhizoclosmatium globosum]|eukprot:ORY42051.1 hypothetical protein BCR33DRAFT_718666 [Rhizoclosmatium globosum]